MAGFCGFGWVLGFVGQWWYGCVGGDLCGGFWLIWVFGSDYGWLWVIVPS